MLLLCTLPAGARLSGAIGVAGAGHSLQDTLDETTGIFGEMVSAFIDGDDETVSELMGEVAKTPGKLIKRAFPVLEAPHMLAEKLKSAKQKIERFAGGVKEGLADARAALAVDRDGTNGGWSDASLLEGEPLQAPADTAFTTPNYESPAAVFAALKGGAGHAPGTTGAGSADTSWDFEKWVIAEQEANPHCYGVVDPETLPPECFGQVDAESPAVKSGADRVDDSPQAGASDWASGNWTVEGDGWSGWDKSDLRYSDDDREAARVGVFAANCWGVYEVSRSHGLYDLMRERMQRNECPNEETGPASSDDAGSGYANALAEMFEDDSAKPAEADYLSELNDLEEKEAEDGECSESPDLYLDDKLTAYRFSDITSIEPNEIFTVWDEELDYYEVTDGLFQACLYNKSWTQQSLPIARENVSNLDVEGSEEWQGELDYWRKQVEVLEAVERGDGVVIKLSGSHTGGDQISQCRKYFARGSGQNAHGCDCFSNWKDSVDWLDDMLVTHGYADNYTENCVR